LRKEQFVSKSMCKSSVCSQKLRCQKDLKLLLRLKEVLVTAKVSLVSFKVNASLITLLWACECKAEETVLKFSNLQNSCQ
jgi:hypothetical protein